MKDKIIYIFAVLMYNVSSVFAEMGSGGGHDTGGGSSSSSIGDTIIDQIDQFIQFIMYIIKYYIIEPPMRIFLQLFGGIADSIGSVGRGMFGGVGGVMNTAWQNLANFLSWTGPFAPVIASIVIWAVVVISVYVILSVILDMLLPGTPFDQEIEK